MEVVKLSREVRQVRSLITELKTRAEEQGDGKYIEGYFAVFNKPTELWPGAFEELAPRAFDKTISDDIRALTDHNTTLVLGRTKANTLELKIDSYGLWGKITINKEDSDAMNLYARVQRGDVDQCSFGFVIVSEETDWRDDGTVKWTITEGRLFEVTICTFPAYEETSVQARKAEVKQHEEKQLLQRKHELKVRLQNGTKANNVKEKN